MLSMRTDSAMRRTCWVRLSLGLLLVGGLLGAATAADSPAKDKPVDPDHAAKMARGLDIFKQHVRPVLTQQCLKCHGGRGILEGDLDIADRAALLKGGASGPAV